MKFRVLFVPVLIAFMVTGITTESLSQLSVNTGTAISLTPQQFVQTYLVGTGVTISNALYNGSSEPLNSSLRTPPKYRDQIGSFTTTGGAQTELGISGGVIMSSGYVAKAIAPNNPSDDMEGTNSPFESDPDLYILANKEINDKSVLEFDFVPETDVITFRYVFSSLEFDNYCGSNYNDAFGLFLSGPGIAGGQGFTNNAVNIAVLPETIAYVTIANVCAADNGNTGKGTYSWWNAAKTYFSYNRLTYVLTASYPVTCNQTYHMKFAIGDAYDGILDSGVFLEQNSFSSNSVMGSTSLSNPLTGQYLVEGCGTATLIYSVAQTHPTNLTIYLSIDPLGTANQADILPNPFPTEIVLPAYSIQTAPILIQAVSDGLTEPVETLIIDATTTTCNVTNTETTEMTIKDVTPMVISAVNKTICDGTPAVLTAVVTGGQPILPASTFNYLWNTTATTQSITVSPPLGHTVYSVTATDACGQAGSTATYVDSGIIPASTSPITGINTVCTPVTGVTYSIPPMTGADSYIWTVPAGAAITSGGSTNTITVDFSISSVSGVITDKGTNSICGPGQPVSLAINVAPNPQAAGSIT
ncbi:MAG: choice-of-anchor L domain-containing protein, partial [Bacteroidota bacterium]